MCSRRKSAATKGRYYCSLCTDPSFGFDGDRPEYCKQHSQQGDKPSEQEVSRSRLFQASKLWCGREQNANVLRRARPGEGMEAVVLKTNKKMLCSGTTAVLCTEPYFGVVGHRPESCKQHSQLGMANLQGKKCCHHGCSKHPSYGVAGSNNREFCLEHRGRRRRSTYVIGKKRCAESDCTRGPSYGVDGSGKAEFCRKHAREEMVSRDCKRCGVKGCTRRGSVVRRGRGQDSGVLQRACQGRHGERLEEEGARGWCFWHY